MSGKNFLENLHRRRRTQQNWSKVHAEMLTHAYVAETVELDAWYMVQSDSCAETTIKSASLEEYS